jgi:arsenate reductase
VVPALPRKSHEKKQMTRKSKILFLCTGNACRSQMAEGWTRKLKSDSIEVYSAGVEIHGLNAHAVKVMAEAGVDISGYRSKHVDEFKDMDLAAVITVCGHAQETCPYFPPRCKVIHAGFDDPPRMAKALAEQGADEQQQLDCYRKIRDEIRAFVEKLPGIC